MHFSKLHVSCHEPFTEIWLLHSHSLPLGPSDQGSSPMFAQLSKLSSSAVSERNSGVRNRDLAK